MSFPIDKFLSKRKVKQLLSISEREFSELRAGGVIKSYRFACDLRRRHYRLSDLVSAMELGPLREYLGWRASFVEPRLRDFQSFVMNIYHKSSSYDDR